MLRKLKIETQAKKMVFLQKKPKKRVIVIRSHNHFLTFYSLEQSLQI